MKFLLALLFPVIGLAQYPLKPTNFRPSNSDTTITDTTGTDTTHIKNKIIYGYHGLWNFAARPINNPEVLDSLATLPLNNLYRWPGGTLASTWQWEIGADSLNSTAENNPLEKVVDYYHKMGGRMDIVFCINMCSRPLSDQMNMLAHAYSLGIPIKWITFDNEVNIETGYPHTVYETAKEYADSCAIAMAAIKAVYPNAKCGIYGENKTWSKKWNDTMIAIHPDGIITHMGPHPVDFLVGGVPDYVKLEKALMDEWTKSGMGLITTVPIWSDEINYNFDLDNVMSVDDATQVTFYVMKRFRELIQLSGNKKTKIVTVRGIEGPAEGAFSVNNSSIIRQPTAFAMQLLQDYIIALP